MVTPEQALGVILAHLFGDYVIQNGWMAREKTSRWWPAAVHGVTYTVPYVLVTQSPWALLVISSTHIVIDRYRLAKYLVWARNQVAPRSQRYAPTETGGPPGDPVWLSVWLLIICDNTVHVAINTAAVLWL